MEPDSSCLDIKIEWNRIRQHFNKSFRSSLHVSIASVDAENRPALTPIGSLFLNPNQTGFYFEKYPSRLPDHAGSNPTVCVLAVNSKRWFWIRSLFRGQFNEHPAIKLYGVLGERRKASKPEITRLQKRMRLTRGFKGNSYLWGDMQFVRDIKFDKAEKINLGKMTEKL